MFTDGWTHTLTDGARKVITTAHPEHSSGELTRWAGHFGFLIGTIFKIAIFTLEVILLLQCKFQLKLPNGS